MKRILVPVDFSKHSEYALEVASILAREHKAGIVVWHMLGLSEEVFDGNEEEGAAEASYYMKLARKRFRSFLNKPYLKEIRITEIVQNYKIFSEIGNVARENGIDLIVMGSHGTGGMREIFVGSNTEKVVRKSEFPVLVVKKRMPHFKPGKAVFAMDFREESIDAYRRAIATLAEWKVEVCLVHVNLPNLQFRSTMETRQLAAEFFRKAHKGKVPAQPDIAYISDYSIERGLYSYAGMVGAELIVVTTHGRSGLAHFFRGSIGEDIANHSPFPVLTFRSY